jgi:2-methylcitrate dehydratase PrpD
MPFGAAAAVLYGNALPDQYTDEIIKSSAVAEVMKKVKIRKDPELERLYPKQWPSRVEIRTTGGQSYHAFIAYPKGDPENPLTWDELIEKFNSVTRGVYAPGRQSQIAGEMQAMSSSPKLDALKSLLGAKDCE